MDARRLAALIEQKCAALRKRQQRCCRPIRWRHPGAAGGIAARALYAARQTLATYS
jgi:hypothetical protein